MGVDAGPWTDQGADFSGCFSWRWRLWREWDPARPAVAFLMLNPSVANAWSLDPTVRRCVGFARAWGYGRLEVVNAFAWVDGDPQGLLRASDPVGPENDEAIRAAVWRSEVTVVAWSGWVNGYVNGRRRDAELDRLLAPYRDRLRVLGYTADGTPRHPLYMPKDTRPAQYVTRDVWAAAHGDRPPATQVVAF